MVDVQQTEIFESWLNSLRDAEAAKRIAMRIIRLQSGLLGDVKFFDGIGELRIDYGPGYRIYFLRRGNAVILLLCGGTKGTQRKDIEYAKKLAREV